jgi:hypothetical protein
MWRGDPWQQAAVLSTVTFAPMGKRRSAQTRPSLASVQVGPFHYIQYPGDSVGRLYDHATDPLEMRNLAWMPDANEVLGSLRDSLKVATSVRAAKGTTP